MIEVHSEVRRAQVESGSPSRPARARLLGMMVTLLVLATVMTIAASFRLPDLERPGRNYDEGVYLESLLLMRHGYRPVADFPASQGPLHLYAAYTSYALGGYSLEAARMGSVLASLFAVGAATWTGVAMYGRVGGLAAAVTLALSPAFLNVSRQALPEAPAVALALLAVGAAAWSWRGGGDRWRVLAGLALAAACLVKPTVASAALPVCMLSYQRRSTRASLLAPATAAIAGLAGLGAAGMGAALEQTIGWRLGGQQVDASPAMIGHNLWLLVDKLFMLEGPAFYALALVGAMLLAARVSGWLAAAVLGWFAGGLALLLVYTNLSSHLAVVLLPSLALLVGAAASAAWGAVARLRRPDLAGLVAAVGILWYGLTVPSLVDRDQRIANGVGTPDGGFGQAERTAVRLIARLTSEDDWVITDQPYLAFLANRKVPPPLVDPSDSRIQAGSLTADQVIGILREYDPDTVVLWTGKLSRFDLFLAEVTSDYVLAQQVGTGSDDWPRLIYRDPDGDTD